MEIVPITKDTLDLWRVTIEQAMEKLPADARREFVHLGLVKCSIDAILTR